MSDREKFFHLDFHKLDRNLSEEERREWNAIYASYRGGSPLSGTVIGVDMFSLNVRSRRTGEVRKRELSCAIVVPYRVRILIPETEMWSGEGRPRMSLNHIMGATLSFNIIKVDRENGFALASRKSAMKARRSYFAHRAELNALGTRLKCRVIDVGPVRCTVECYGHDIRLTQKDLCYMSVSDLRAVYRPGQELDCVVTDYDADADRLRISVKAALSDPFEGAERRHPVNSRRQAVISGKYAGGVFCNLPDGTVCMCSYDRLQIKVVTEDIADRDKRLAVLKSKQSGGDGSVNATISLSELYAMQQEVATIHVPDAINELADDVLCELRNSGIEVSDRKYLNYYPLVQAKAWLEGHDKVESQDLLILKCYLWQAPSDRPTVENTLTRLCVNPLQDKVNSILAMAVEAQEDFNTVVVDGGNPKAGSKALLKLRGELLQLYKRQQELCAAAQSDTEKDMVNKLLNDLETISMAAHNAVNFTYIPLEQMAALQ